MARDKILKAAEKLFMRKGFEATTVRELACKAEVNVAMISYYFGSKEKLLEALFSQRAEYNRHKLIDINQDPKLNAEQKLDLVLGYYIDRILSNHGFHLLVFRELSLSQRRKLHGIISEKLLLNQHEIKKIIEEGKASGVFHKNIDIELTINSIYGIIYQSSNRSFTKTFISGYSDKKEFKARLKKHLSALITSYLKHG